MAFWYVTIRETGDRFTRRDSLHLLNGIWPSGSPTLIARMRTPYRIVSVDDKNMAVLPDKDFSLLRFAAAMLTIGCTCAVGCLRSWVARGNPKPEGVCGAPLQVIVHRCVSYLPSGNPSTDF